MNAIIIRTPLRVWIRSLAVLAAVGMMFGAAPLSAREKSPPKADDTPQLDENEILGEVFISTKVQFVKFQLDDKKDWDNHEYIDGAKTLVIKGIDRSVEHTLTLTPRESGFGAVTLTLKPEDFKRTILKVKGRTQTLTFRAKASVSFKRLAPPAAEPKSTDSYTP